MENRQSTLIQTLTSLSIEKWSTAYKLQRQDQNDILFVVIVSTIVDQVSTTEVDSQRLNVIHSAMSFNRRLVSDTLFDNDH